MKPEEAIKLIESTDADYDIKNIKWKGMEIISKYVDEFNFAAEHDILYICGIDPETVLIPSFAFGSYSVTS